MSCRFGLLVLDSAMFPHIKTVIQVIRNRYRQNRVKQLRKLEIPDCELRKAQFAPEFLINCNNSFQFAPEFFINCNNSVVVKFLSLVLLLKFLNFGVATKYLISSRTYQQCQLSLLHKEISQKKKLM